MLSFPRSMFETGPTYCRLYLHLAHSLRFEAVSLFSSNLIFSSNPIDTLQIPGYPGALGLVACPGVRIGRRAKIAQVAFQWQTQWRLQNDLKRIKKWGADGIVTLLEESELKRMGLEELPDAIEKAGMWWNFLPIQDRQAPDDYFEDAWETKGACLREGLAEGQRIIIHCFAGLGRTGMIAARILVECGMDPARAIANVRQTTPARIQSREQFYFVKNLNGKTDGS